MDDMTPTDKLRTMLDERGIEWKELDSVHPITVWHDGQTSYEYMERTLLDGVTPYTGEVVDGTGRLEAVIHVCTPEQAIAATVGVATCKDVCASNSEFTCSECGFNCELTSWISLFDGDDGRHRHHHHGTPNFCPNCGRHVKQ